MKTCYHKFMDESIFRKKVIGTVKYGKLLSKTDLVLRFTASGVSLFVLVPIFYVVFTDKGGLATIVGGMVGVLWLFVVLSLLAGAMKDVFNRRLVSRCFRAGDLQEGEASLDLPRSFRFKRKVTLALVLPSGATKRSFSVTSGFAAEFSKRRWFAVLYSPSHDAVLLL